MNMNGINISQQFMLNHKINANDLNYVQEIMDKIKQLQEATGNKDLEFTDKDLEGDFDPEKYDDRMQVT